MDLQFGQYRLKHSGRQLLGPEGPVELSARSFDILTVLLDHSGEVVSKREILDAVWPGQVVEENTLHVHVSALRKALPAGLIKTVQGRGYLYSGPKPVTDVLASEATITPPSDRRPVVVVLPFEFQSADPGRRGLGDGIAADIADRLARFRLFLVIGQHSASALRAMAGSFVVIREKLNADFMVSGTLHFLDERFRLAIRLTEVASEKTIWSERYDRQLSDLFDLQDEIGSLVATAIARHLEVEISIRSSRRRTISLSSYEQLLQGLWHYKKLTYRDNLAARKCFERAIELDPQNAQALDWLGMTYCEDWVRDFSSLESQERGVELIAKAVELDPADGLIHTGHAWALLRMGELERALRASELSVDLNPGDPNILATRALVLGYDGQLAEAKEFLRRAGRLDPIPAPWIDEVGGILAFIEGDYKEALVSLEPFKGCALDLMYALACYGILDRTAKARDTLARLSREGRYPNWTLGIAHEPYRNLAIRERLSVGLQKALSLTI